jgi:hypothetical protein
MLTEDLYESKIEYLSLFAHCGFYALNFALSLTVLSSETVSSGMLSYVSIAFDTMLHHY